MSYEITGHTQLACVLGHPIAHSISPQMHNEAFRLLGIDAAYLAFDVTPDRLPTVFAGLKEMHALGFNLTMPLKTAVLPLVDELTPAAALAQSVNTVYFRDGKAIGHSTDGIGYLDSLRDAGFYVKGQKMTLLGAGGAATAICVQAALDGVSAIDVFKRKNETFAQTEAFLSSLSSKTGCPIRLFDIKDEMQLQASLMESALLTNATSVGMGDDPSCPIPDSVCLPSNLFVSDLIYHPQVTPLLKKAGACGCTCLNGMYMLLFQGAASFFCWTGKDMPIEPIREKYFNF